MLDGWMLVGVVQMVVNAERNRKTQIQKEKKGDQKGLNDFDPFPSLT